MTNQPFRYRFKHLTGWRQKIFLAVAEEIVPADETGPGGRDLATAALADWAIARLEPSMQKLLLTFLIAWECFGFLFGGKPFTRLSSSARRRQMRWFETAPLPAFRTGFYGLRAMALMGVYCREDSWPGIGYEGPLLKDRPSTDPEIRALQQRRVEAAP